MKIIEKLSEMIEEELEDAEKYIKCALHHKEDNPGLADTFYQLSKQEMGHVDMLHAQVKDQIESYRAQNGDPPEGMKMLYEYLHKKHIDHALEIRHAMEMYKE